jgi:hypothetical protein
VSPRRRVPPREVGPVWPAPARVRVSRSTGPGETGYLVVPSLSRPRLLVPLAVPGATQMLRRHGGNRVQRTARSIWRVLHRSALTRRLPITRLTVIPEPNGIEAYLGARLSGSVRIGVLLGPPRANAKPVLQVFDESGATVAFAKLGSTTLTAALVDNEAAALVLLGRTAHRTFSAPALLSHGRWRETPVLVQAALALSQSDLAPATPPVPVMAEIAALSGIHEQRLDGSAFLAESDPGPQTSWHDIDLEPFRRLHAALGSAGSCAFGSCHGDFGPWNMARDGSVVEVWDWERFAAAVPVGFDAAHYRTQEAFARSVEPGPAWTSMVDDVSTLLTTLGLAPDRACIAAGCYLLAICARYRSDAAKAPTPTLRRRMRWLSATAAVAVQSLDGAYA